VLLAFLPKVAAVLALIPSPVMGAGLIYVACHLVSSGTELIASRMLDARRIYVIGLPLLAGVGIIAMPDIAGHFPPWAAVVVASTLANATILALALTLRPECRRIQPGVNDHRA
jgi:xanthine permease XanP